MNSLQELVEILASARKLLALPENNFAWSSWDDAPAALAEVDELLASVEAGHLPPRPDLEILFAPTGPIQEVGISSGWGRPFLDLASRFDVVAERVWHSR